MTIVQEQFRLILLRAAGRELPFGHKQAIFPLPSASNSNIGPSSTAPGGRSDDKVSWRRIAPTMSRSRIRAGLWVVPSQDYIIDSVGVRIPTARLDPGG